MRIERVEDPQDPRLDAYRCVRDRERWRGSDLFVVESRLVVRRLLAGSRFRARSVLATPAALEGLREALERAPGAPVVYVASHALIHSVLAFRYHRGCLALAERGPDLPAGSLLAPPGARTLLVLEDLADPENVGAIFRNARAFGADGVLLSPGTADPLYAKAVRASVGAVLTVPFARLEGWPADLGRLREAGYALVALTPDGALEVADLGAARPLPERVALLLGSEGAGLGAAARAAADLAVRIAMAPGVDSLNVAVASGIALHALRGARTRDAR